MCLYPRHHNCSVLLIILSFITPGHLVLQPQIKHTHNMPAAKRTVTLVPVDGEDTKIKLELDSDQEEKKPQPKDTKTPAKRPAPEPKPTKEPGRRGRPPGPVNRWTSDEYKLVHAHVIKNGARNFDDGIVPGRSGQQVRNAWV